MACSRILAAGFVAAKLIAQSSDAPQSGARQLPYFRVSQKDTLPPLRKQAVASKSPAVRNLGFRYTVVLVADGKPPQAVDPDRNFRNGECVALRMESTHSGYLYVLALQSSGGWQPMLPNSRAPEETNVIDPGQTILVPARYCFEIADPPGVDTLSVMLSRDPTDVFDLDNAIRPAAPEPTLASARVVNREVDRLSKQYGTRELVFHKVEKAASKSEPQYSVSVVSGADKPVSMVVAKIALRHQ